MLKYKHLQGIMYNLKIHMIEHWEMSSHSRRTHNIHKDLWCNDFVIYKEIQQISKVCINSVTVNLGKVMYELHLKCYLGKD